MVKKLILMMFLVMILSSVGVLGVTVKTYNTDYQFVEVGYLPPTEIPDQSYNYLTVDLSGDLGYVELKGIGSACDDGIIDSKDASDSLVILNLTYSGGADCKFSIFVDDVDATGTLWVRKAIPTSSCTKEYCDSDCKVYDVSYVCEESGDTCADHLVEDNCVSCTNGYINYDDYVSQFGDSSEIVEAEGYAMNSSNNQISCDPYYEYYYSPNVCTDPSYVVFNEFGAYLANTMTEAKCNGLQFNNVTCSCSNDYVKTYSSSMVRWIHRGFYDINQRSEVYGGIIPDDDLVVQEWVEEDIPNIGKIKYIKKTNKIK